MASSPPLKSDVRITVGVVLVTFLVALEGTVVSTAMPKVVEELGGLTQYAWVFSGYLTAVAVTGPLWGKLADRIGSRGAYLASTLVFLFGSLAAGLSQTMQHLIAARVLQGLGGGGITPLSQVILAENNSREERARLQGYLVAVWGLASIAGPPLGGFLASEVNWRWVFYLNLPFGILGMLTVWLFLKSRPPSTRRALDVPGFALFLLAYSALLWACEARNLPSWVVCAILGSLLLKHQLSQKEPFFPVQLRVYPHFGKSFWLAPAIGIGVFGAISYLPLYLQGVLGQSPAQSGRTMLPLLLFWTCSAGVGPRLALRYGTRPCLLAASSALLLAFLGLQQGPQHPLVLALCQMGVGLAGGLSFTPLTLAVQEEVPPEYLASATSSVVFLRMLGASLGTSLMGAFLPDQEVAGQLGPALQKAFWLGCAVSIVAVLASLQLPRRKAPTLTA